MTSEGAGRVKRLARACWRVSLTVALIPALTSCTLIGMSVGSFMSRQDTIPHDRQQGVASRADQPPELGDWVEIDLADGRTLAGTYRGMHHSAFAVQTDQGVRPAPFDQVRELRVVRGSYVLQGTAVGLALDLSVYLLASRGGREKPALGWPN